jgi:thiol-disulfide isomerase/thioredoxin
MKEKLLFLFILFFLNRAASSQSALPVYNFDQFKERTSKANDTLYVVNFWATWCRPCIQELPYFQMAADSLINSRVKFLLVSMDMKSQAMQAASFLQRKNYKVESFILSQANPNAWINKVEQKWTGAIPMTIFYRNKEKLFFHEGDFENERDLLKAIHSKLK